MPQHRDYAPLMRELSDEYARHAPTSAALNQRAKTVMVDGGSHNLRLIQPFPPRLASAGGAWLTDEDGNRILDFWQGHFANILGHNPSVITSTLAEALAKGWGMQTGFTDRTQVEVAEILCRRTGQERVRFTTSGALATMYATTLARAFTGRDLVLKVGGGWHGGQPWALKGVYWKESGAEPWQVESEGLPGSAPGEVLVTRFNDSQRLRDIFLRTGERLACFIVEPFIGSGGYILADPEYLRTARQLADQYGVVLIFDEVISGFRFRAGDLGGLYGVHPDLATFAKIMGGGMPVAAIAGRADIMKLCGREGGVKVRASGGTYSAHPASMLAAKTMMEFLAANEDIVYPRLAVLGASLRHTVEAAFAAEDIYVKCTGYPNEVVAGSAMAMPHFPWQPGHSLVSPDDVNDPHVCDAHLREHVFQLALLCEDVNVVHGLGAASTAHTESDIAFFGAACTHVARRLKPYLS